MTDYEEILKLKELKNARVIGGKSGLNQPISWIHIVYDVNIGPWIGPSNLVYTNGSGFSYPDSYAFPREIPPNPFSSPYLPSCSSLLFATSLGQ